MAPNEIVIDDVIRVIDFHLRKLVKRHIFRNEECDDIRQDIIVAVYENCASFDPELSSWLTFVNMIVLRELKRQRLQKRWRKHQNIMSLEEIEPEEEPLTNFYPTYVLNEVELHAFLGEIRDTIRTFPEKSRTVCKWLSLYSKREVALRLNMEPSELSREITKIRQLFKRSKVFADLF